MRKKPMKILRGSALALVALALASSPAAAREAIANGTTTAIDFDESFKAKKVKSQIIVLRVPASFDPSKNSSLTFLCGVNAFRRNIGEDGTISDEKIKKIKGQWSATLLVVDEGAGTVEPVELGSGRFNTDALGTAVWNVTIETEDFAAGFPGDTAALVHSEVRYTKNKAVSLLGVACRIFVRS